jgi:hypothetical protein
MRAVRVHQFGSLEAIVYEEAPGPAPAERQALIRAKTAWGSLWDAWVRAGKSALPQSLPLILGSDLSVSVLGTRDARWEAPQAWQARLGGRHMSVASKGHDQSVEHGRQQYRKHAAEYVADFSHNSTRPQDLRLLTGEKRTSHADNHN